MYTESAPRTIHLETSPAEEAPVQANHLESLCQLTQGKGNWADSLLQGKGLKGRHVVEQ